MDGGRGRVARAVAGRNRERPLTFAQGPFTVAPAPYHETISPALMMGSRGHRWLVAVWGRRGRWLVSIAVRVATRIAIGINTCDGDGSSLGGRAIRIENTQAVGMLMAVPGYHKDHLAILEGSCRCDHLAIHQELCARLEITAREADGRLLIGMLRQDQRGLSQAWNRVSQAGQVVSGRQALGQAQASQHS